MKFSIKDSFSKCDQIGSFLAQFAADLVTFTEAILNGKHHFLYSVNALLVKPAVANSNIKTHFPLP